MFGKRRQRIQEANGGRNITTGTTAQCRKSCKGRHRGHRKPTVSLRVPGQNKNTA